MPQNLVHLHQLTRQGGSQVSVSAAGHTTGWNVHTPPSPLSLVFVLMLQQVQPRLHILPGIYWR